ncbi:MAG: flagellin [Aigarchaeota archaeon]|nr:flagellin [Aigarchaeota archaeon]MDW8092580.1 hypothetical protein [Nitrososphaerota archaeon]
MVGSVLVDSVMLISTLLIVTAMLGVYTMNFSAMTDANRLQVEKLRERLMTEIMITVVFYNPVNNKVVIYLKNVGSADVSHGDLTISDVYIISQDRYIHLTYSSAPETGKWTYELLNDLNRDAKWGPGETTVITALIDRPLSSGSHKVMVVLKNGVSAEEVFST